MKKLIITLIVLKAQMSFAVAFYMSEDHQILMKSTMCMSSQTPSQWKVQTPNHFRWVDDGLTSSLKAVYQGAMVEIARLNEKSTGPATNDCRPKETVMPVDGKEMKFYRYDSFNGEMIFDTQARTVRLVPMDSRHKVLLIRWETGYCEDPGDSGDTLVRDPDVILFFKQLALNPDPAAAQKVKEQIIKYSEMRTGEGELAVIKVYELAVPATKQSLFGYNNLSADIKEMEYADFLIDMTSTQLLNDDISFSFKDHLTCE